MSERDIDWDALIGFEGTLLRPVRHEGVTYSRAVVKYWNHRRWLFWLQLAERTADRAEIGMWMPAESFERGLVFAERPPVLPGPYDGMIEALANSARASRRDAK